MSVTNICRGPASNWAEMDWEVVRDGVYRKIFTGDGATIQLTRLIPGHEPSPHAHPYEQLVYILSGEIDFHVADTVTRLKPGGLLKVQPNVQHWGEVVGDEPVLNLDVFTPKRDDLGA